MERKRQKEYVVGIAKTSALVYGVRLMAELLSAGCKVRLILDEPVWLEIKEYQGNMLGNYAEMYQWISEFQTKYPNLFLLENEQEKFLEMSSSNYDAMVIIPCPIEVMEAIVTQNTASELSSYALTCMKQRKKLIIVPRQTPLEESHLETMLGLVRKGVKLVPTMPSFEQYIRTLEDMIDFVTERILEELRG